MSLSLIIIELDLLKKPILASLPAKQTTTTYILRKSLRNIFIIGKEWAYWLLGSRVILFMEF